jgi:hypothetical protein
MRLPTEPRFGSFGNTASDLCFCRALEQKTGPVPRNSEQAPTKLPGKLYSDPELHFRRSVKPSSPQFFTILVVVNTPPRLTFTM